MSKTFLSWCPLASLMTIIIALSSSTAGAQLKGTLQQKQGKSARPDDALRKKVSGPKSAQLGKALQKPGWILTFSDEFDTLDGLDHPQNPSAWWDTRYPWGPTLNNELEYYTSYSKHPNPKCNPGGANHLLNSGPNVGALQLVAKQEPGSYEVWRWDASNTFYTTCDPYGYTSGMIFSKQSFLYGYFEIRAKIPNEGKVLWPAFWLYKGGGDEYREIDIFEFGGHTPNRVGMNMHIAQKLDNGYVNAQHWANDPINSYPGSYTITSGPNVSDDFHTYAVKWMPNSVVWYVDDVPVYTVTKHTPHRDMHLIANLAIAPWDPPDPSVSFPAVFEIDYIRVYRSKGKEFMWHWSNAGDGKTNWWSMNPADRYFAGNFDGAKGDELLAVSAGGWAHLMSYGGGAWQTPWINNGSGKINWWMMKQSDQYVAGDFDGDGRDELLAVAANGWAQLMRYDGTSWQTPWINNGGGKINWWNINAGDRYIAGDFDQDGRDELLAVAAKGWSHLMVYNNSGWQTPWINNGSGKINWWNINPSDRYLAGDFDQDGRDELLAVAANGWAQLMKYDGTSWQTPWMNEGAGTMHLWFMKPTDKYVAGDFDKDGLADLFSVSINGWSHLMRYTLP